MKNTMMIAICIILMFLLNGCEDERITKIEISPISEINIHSIASTKQIQGRLKAQIGNYMNDDAQQKIEWVSTNPAVAIVSNKERNSYELDYIVKADIKMLSEGTTEIYAKTTDGSVESGRVKVICGLRTIKEQTTPYDKSPIAKLELSKIGDIIVKSGKEPSALSVKLSTANGLYKNHDAIEKIKWVSTCPEVAEVSSKTPEGYSLDYSVNAKITMHSEGITEIYAQTVDGSIVSNTVKLIYGNKFNIEDTVDYDVANYIAKKLKYPTQTSKELYKARPSYVMKDRTVFVYQDNTRGSNVKVTETTINGKTVKAKGMIHTFTENGMDAQCNFSLELEYNDDFTESKIISETYGAPELILPELN
jgi:hypothetical protein